MKNIFKKFNSLTPDSYNLKARRGFVVLYTVLISTIVLAITVGIVQISYGEIVLSGGAKDGNIAFFAADSGIECGLYLDIKQDVFGSTPGVLSCNNSAILDPANFSLELSNNSCAMVTIQKDIPNPGQTQIESAGYNFPCASITPTANIPRLVSRVIRVTYGEATGGGGGDDDAAI